MVRPIEPVYVEFRTKRDEIAEICRIVLRVVRQELQRVIPSEEPGMKTGNERMHII